MESLDAYPDLLSDSPSLSLESSDLGLDSNLFICAFVTDICVRFLVVSSSFSNATNCALNLFRARSYLFRPLPLLSSPKLLVASIPLLPL